MIYLSIDNTLLMLGSYFKLFNKVIDILYDKMYKKLGTKNNIKSDKKEKALNFILDYFIFKYTEKFKRPISII